MAKINYYGVQVLLKDYLNADLNAEATVVAIELEPDNVEIDRCPYVGIYLTNRDPPEDEPIATGLIQRYTIRIELWCWQANLNRQQAFEDRDNLIGDVEIAIMNIRKNKDLGVLGFRLLGGEFESYPDEQMYIAGGSIILEFETQATIL